MSLNSLDLLLDVIAGIFITAVFALLIMSGRGRRCSTIAAALNQLTLVLASVGLYYVADRGENWWPIPWVVITLKLFGISGIAVAVTQLSKLLPRAVAFRDRNSLMQAADELRQSKERFDRALRGASSGMWEWNLEASTIWYSPRYRELLGYESETDFPNAFESWEMAVHPDDRDWVIRTVGHHLEYPDDFDIEFRMKTKFSQYRWYGCKGLPIRGVDGRPIIVSGSIQDIHEKKCLQQVTRKLDEYTLQKHKMESLGELAGGIAHEFNNFLQAIGGQLQFIKRSLPENTEINSEVDMATELLEQASRETRRLLAFGKQKAADRQQVRPNSMLLQLKAVLGPLMDNQVKIHIKCGKRLGLISADPVSIQQALVNLAINARDAMPQGGDITFATEQMEILKTNVSNYSNLNAGKYIGFAVTDTGTGISEEVQKRLFEPFFSTKPRTKGTGLGLSIVKSIVEEHGGFVEFISARDLGTTFKLWFPAVRTRKARQKHKVRRNCNSPTFALLYVEDDKYIRRSIAHEFQERGVKVVLASDGVAAVKVFEQCPGQIDLAVLDVSMPELNGKEVMFRLRETNPDLPVVFCTAYAGILNEDNVLDEKNTYLVEKPFKFPSLWRTVQHAISRREILGESLSLSKGEPL